MISSCIIAKNEEKFIDDCIKSVLDISEEIILLDTGSTDKTIEIAKKYKKVKIYHDIWKDDFSYSMNKCISYAKNDWLLIIDADERINEYTQKNIVSYLENHKDKDKPLIIKFRNINVNSNRFTQNYYKCGIMRNNKGVYFVVPAHQYPTNDDNSLILESSNDFCFYHLQESTKESLISRNKKSIEILIRFLENKENSSHAFYCYRHIGDSYNDLGDYNKAVEYYIKSYEAQKPILKNFFYVENLLRLAKQMLFRTFEYKRSFEYIEELFKVDPEKRESLFYYAYVNHRLKNIDIALSLYNQALEIKTPFLELQIFGELGRCYIQKKDFEKGLFFLEKAYQIDPKSYITYHLIKHFFVVGNIEKALEYKLVLLDYPKDIIQKELMKIGNLTKNQKTEMVNFELNKLKSFSGWDSWEI